MAGYEQDIAQIKEKIINQILSASAVISMLALASTWLRDIDVLNYFIIIQSISVFIIFILAVLRKRISIAIKAVVIVGVVFIIFSFDLYNLGFLASTKVFLIIVPILISFLYSYKKSLMVLMLYMVFYILFGCFHIKGFLPHELNHVQYVFGARTWLTDGLVLFLCSFTLLYIGKNFYSELKKAINNKISSEIKYKELFEKANDAIVLLKDGKFFDSNQRTYEIFQYNKDELIGKHISDICPEYQFDGQDSLKQAEQLINLTEQGIPQQFEWQHKKSNGELFDLSISLTRVILHDQIFVLGILRNITDKKKKDAELEMHRYHLEELVQEKTIKLEEALESWKSTSEDLVEKNIVIEKQNIELRSTLFKLKEAQAKLFQAEKMASLGILTAGVAHEINNPLNYLSGAYYGLTAYFKKHGSMDNEKTSMLLSSIETGINRVSAIVKGLNHFSRDNSHFGEDCDIHSILDNCLAVLQDQLKNKVEVIKKYHNELLSVKGNVGKLHQVFINIIINSVHAIDTSGQITIATCIKGENCVIEISDTGSGISKENLSKITDPFFTTKDPGKGTGLGLSISYTIIQNHKGSIGFESELNKGTKVTIRLPLK